LDRKMNDTFFDGLDELYHHALGFGLGSVRLPSCI